MQKWTVVATTFHEEEFYEFVFILLKPYREIDEFTFAIEKKKIKKTLQFRGTIIKPQTDFMRRAFMHTQVRTELTRAAPVLMTDSSKFLSFGQLCGDNITHKYG